MKRPMVTLLASTLATAVALSGSLSLVAAAADDSSDASIYIGSLYEPQNLDNTAGGGQGVTEAFNGNVYESLFQLTDDGDVVPLLAESYTLSDDALTYTFQLKPGVHFHSGKEVTSEDVKFSIERVFAPESQSARRSSFGAIASIEAPTPDTLVVTLESPSISFIYNLTYVWVMNKDATDFTTTEDGTGPYVLDQWTRGSALALSRFDDYWGTPAANKEVVFNYFTDATALSNALLTDAVDIVTNVQSPDALGLFEDNPDYVVNNGTSTTKELMAFNDRVEPFDKVEVRKAVYSAIDRAKLLNAVWGDKGTLIGSMVPPTDPWYIDLVDENPYDPELAQQLLADAGYADGFEFTLDTPTYDPHPLVAEFIKSELAKVGVTVNINPITSDEWYSKVFKAAGLRGDAAGARQRPRRGLVRQPRLLLGLRQPAGDGLGRRSRGVQDRRRADGEAQARQRADRQGCGQRVAVPVPAAGGGLRGRQRLPHQRSELAVPGLRHRQGIATDRGPDARAAGPRSTHPRLSLEGTARLTHDGSVPTPSHRHPRGFAVDRDGGDLPPPASIAGRPGQRAADGPGDTRADRRSASPGGG